MSDPSKSNDKRVKTNGLGVDPMERLASFKPTRNLTLGGPKPNKKIFVPNLNVTRNKAKSSSVKNHENKKEYNDKDRGDRGNDRIRYMKNGSNNIIQSTGIFSSGPGRTVSVPHRQSHGYGIENTSPHRPVLRVRDVKAIDKELEDQRIKLMRSSGINENYDDEDFKGTGNNEAPIKLPVDDGWTIPSSKPIKIKAEVVVKSEFGDDDEVKLDLKPLLKTEMFENTDVVHLLRSERPGLILVKFPESLPGRGGVADEQENNHENNNDIPPTKCVLKNLEEGRIGKLLVHRSGRVTFALGNNHLEVNLGKQSSFYQEVISVGVDERSRSARLVSLGPLQHKLVVVPDWEAILKDLSS